MCKARLAGLASSLSRDLKGRGKLHILCYNGVILYICLEKTGKELGKTEYILLIRNRNTGRLDFF